MSYRGDWNPLPPSGAPDRVIVLGVSYTEGGGAVAQFDCLRPGTQRVERNAAASNFVGWSGRPIAAAYYTIPRTLRREI